MKLYFSENIDCQRLEMSLPVATLAYRGNDGATVGLILDGSTYSCESSMQFSKEIVIRMGTGAVNIIPDRDSIALAGGTVNERGVEPDRQNPEMVPVEIEGEYIRIAASSNPFNVQEPLSGLPSEIRSFYENVITASNGTGVIIAVYSSIPLQATGGSYGVATIYDALGNIIRGSLELKAANSMSKTSYGVYWNGTNRNSRTVGPGTYLARMTVIDIKGIKRVLQIKLGVVNRTIP
jgi:hypothetical protein